MKQIDLFYVGIEKKEVVAKIKELDDEELEGGLCGDKRRKRALSRGHLGRAGFQ